MGLKLELAQDPDALVISPHSPTTTVRLHRYDHKQVVWSSLGWKPEGVRLNLACGDDVREGWTNVDYHYSHQGGVRTDLFRFPWPFETGSVDAILMDNYLEHVPHRVLDDYVDGHETDGLLRTMNEVYRILRPGGTILIQVPYANTLNDLHNPVHYRSLVPSTLAYLWDERENAPTQQEGGTARFRLLKLRVRRYFGTYRFNNQYHVPRYFGFTADWIGKKWEIAWLLERI